MKNIYRKVSTTVAILVVTIILGQALLGVTGPAFAQEQSNICPVSSGFWKNHPDLWPVPQTLGTQTYASGELLSLLRAPANGDASIILAHQLIATLLNLANGSDPAPIGRTVTSGQSLLAEFEGKLPYEVPTSSALGQEQLAAKELLENYNKGQMTLDCAPGRKAGIGSISGVVSEATRGRPVEGALVLATLDGTPQRSVTTDANGLYAMLGLTPGTYVLEAFNPPFPPSHIEDIEVVGQQHTVVDFRLALPPPPEEEGAIGGTVIDARTGEPTGVPVEILVLQDGEPLPVTGSARPSSGAFLVEGIPAGTYSVSAFALGYRLSQLDGVEVQAGQPTIVDLELLPLSNAEAGLIQGTLTVNGVPAAGINPGPGLAPPIVVQLMLGDHILASAIPDQRGQYVLRGVPAGSYSLAGEVFTPLLSVRVDDVAVGMGEQVVVDLDIPSPFPLGSVSGIVVDASTEARIEGATIGLRADFVGIPQLIPVATSGVDGRYAIPTLLPGEYALEASASGYESLSAERVAVIPGEDTAVDFQLQPGSPPGDRPPTAVACWTDRTGALICSDPNSASVSPLTTVQLDGLLSFDPERDPLSYEWRVAATPAGSVARISDPTSPVPTLFVDLAGDYVVCLVVTDATGLTSPEACITIHASATGGLLLQLTWDTAQSDLDLHFLHPNGPWEDLVWDCNWGNRSPNWGDPASTADDPSLDLDDVDGLGPENLSLAQPEDGVSYKVGVHYFGDQGGGPTVPTIRIFVDGALVYEKVGSALPEGGYFWEAAEITWSRGSASITEIDRITPTIP